jgi:PAS domain S-box-containing protein
VSSRPDPHRQHRAVPPEPGRAPAAPPIDLALLLDNVAELAIAVVGGRVGYINRPGIALLGYASEAQVIGKRLETIVDPRTLHSLLVGRKERGSGSAPSDRVRAPLKRADGSSVDAELRVVVMSGTDALAVVARPADVTAVLAGDTPAAAIHAADGLKNLIANMAHELRTPLNAIIGFSEIIAERMFGDLNDRYAAYAGDIMSSGHHLLRIINDILDYAKVEAGEMTLRAEKASVNDVVRSSLRLVTGQAEQAGLEIVDQLADISKPLYIDSTKVKQIVVNLLSNAIKFTPRGGQVRVGSKLVAPDRVEIWVTDTGIGMTEAEVAEAILPFRQPRRPPDGSYTGTGLGLPIAKALVSLHGGELRIASKPKAGTDVRFTLKAQFPGVSSSSLLGT